MSVGKLKVKLLRNSTLKHGPDLLELELTLSISVGKYGDSCPTFSNQCPSAVLL